MGMGLAGLGTASGAAQGLQEILAQRLRERQMALQEQAQRESVELRRRELEMRQQEVEAERASTDEYRQDVLATQAQTQRGMAVDRAARQTPYQFKLARPQAETFKAYGYPVNENISQEQLNSPLANEALEPDEYTYGGNQPTPAPSKLMTPAEMAQWKAQKEFEARVNRENRPPSAEAAGTWTDTGRTDAQGNAIYVNTKTTETKPMPFGAKQSPGASQEADRKRILVVDATNRTLNALDELIDERGNLRPETRAAIGASRMTGMQYIPGTQAYNAQASIDRLRARMVTDLMAELKAQSRTGATGFGQLNAQELKVMQDSAAKLDPGQGEKAFQTELQNIRRRLELILKDGPPGQAAQPSPGGRYEIVR